MNNLGIFEIDSALAEKLALPADALISLSDLRRVDVMYTDFDGADRCGSIICAASAAKDVEIIFRELYELRYPIEKIRFAHEYGFDDDLIMADNASSCFNYRFVANTNRLSLHARGLAIDINPLYNPYIQNGVIMPANAMPYADRNANFPHKITHDDPCFKTFTKHGWLWGGDWTENVDYQHFYKPESTVTKIARRLGIV